MARAPVDVNANRILHGQELTALKWAATPRVALPGQYRFFFYSSDCAEAPHVHVRHESSMAKLCLDEDASLAQNDGFNGRELRQIRRHVKQYRRTLLDAWSEHCG